MVQQEWNYSDYSTKMGKIESKLAELRYIDKALEYIESITSISAHGPGHQSISVDLGTTYPFTKWFRVFGTNRSDAIESKLQGYADAAGPWASGVMGPEERRVKDVVTPMSSVFEWAALELENEVAVPLKTLVADDFGGLNASISDWDGDAHNNFVTEFYEPMDECADNQALLAQYLSRYLGMGKAIVDLGQNSVMNTVATIEKAVDDQLLKRQEESEGASAEEILTLASAATGLLALVPVPGANVALAGVSTVCGYAATQVPPESKATQNISSSTAEGLAADLTTTFTTIMANYDNHWEGLQRDRIEPLVNNVTEFESMDLFYPDRPDLADGASPEDFHHDSSPHAD